MRRDDNMSAFASFFVPILVGVAIAYIKTKTKLLFLLAIVNIEQSLHYIDVLSFIGQQG